MALLALLQCSALARAQNCTADTDLQILYKTFAQNLGAFNVFLDLIPVRRLDSIGLRCVQACIEHGVARRDLCHVQAPSQARVKTLYSAWLDKSEGDSRLTH